MRRIVALTLVGAIAGALACAPRIRPAANGPSVEAEVLAFLESWNRTLSGRDTSAIASFYVADSALRWYEDGALRYSSRNEVLAALAAFPPNTDVATDLNRINVVVITADRVHIKASFRTQIRMPTDSFAFAGVFTALLHRGPSGWHFVTGHTSTVRANSR